MDFRDICNVFGGSPFYEDAHTDFPTVEKKLRARRRDQTCSTRDEIAALHLLHGIMSLMIGDFHSAQYHFDDLRDPNLKFRSRWARRASVYSILACMWQEFPPILEPCNLDGPALRIWMNKKRCRCGPALKIWTDQKGCRCNAQRFLRVCELEQESMMGLDKLEYAIIQTVFMSRRLLQQLRYGNLYRLSSSEDIRCNFEVITRRLKILVSHTLKLGFPAVSTYLIRIQYDLAHVMGHRTARNLLTLLISIHQATEDSIGFGYDCLILGDRVLSPCHTSPLALNFSIVDELDEYGGDSTMYFPADSMTPPSANRSLTCPSLASADAKRVAAQISAAISWYEAAYEYFKRADLKRGMALSTLRKACAYQMYDLKLANPSGTTTIQDQSVNDLLMHSLKLALECEDIPIGIVTKFHWLCGRQMSLTLRSEIRKMALLCLIYKNEVLGLGIALLGLRIGHYSRYAKGTIHLTAQGYEICRQIIKVMGCFRTVWYSAMLAQFQFSISMGNRSHAALWTRHMKDLSDRFIDESMVGSHTDQGLNTVLWYFTAVIDAVAILGPSEDEKMPFPDSSTEAILGYLESGTPATQAYAKAARDRLRHSAMVTWYRRHLQNGNLEKAVDSLCTYKFDSKILYSQSQLSETLQAVDILFWLGNLKAARQIMTDCVSNHQLLPDFSEQIANLAYYPMAGYRYQRDRRKLKSLQSIFLLCVQTGLWNRAASLNIMIEEFSPGYFTSVLSYTNLWPWERCLYAGLVLKHQGDRCGAFFYFSQVRYFLLDLTNHLSDDDYRLLLARTEVSRWMGAFVALMLQNFLSRVRNINPRLDLGVDRDAFCMFRYGLEIPDLEMYQRDALMLMESIRPQYLWKYASSTFTGKQIEGQQKYELWKELYRKDKRTPEEQAELDSLHPLRETYFARSLETRHLRRLTFELNTRPIDSYIDIVPDNAVVLYQVPTHDYILLIAIDNKKLRMAVLAPIGITRLEKCITRFIDAIRRDDKVVIDEFGDELSRILIDPMNNVIAKRQHIIFVSSGILTRVPVAALKYRGDYLILKREISQVPSLTALEALIARTQSRKKGNAGVTVIARSGTPRDRVHQWLPMAGVEAMLIGSLHEANIFNAKDVSRSTFRDLIGKTDFLHITTHGYLDPDHPFFSYIVLKERIRVLDLMSAHNNLSLVTFSACFSGIGHASDSGDVQGLSHAILAAGANACLGALWAVNDVSTMIHMWLFYKTLFIKSKKPTLAQAWREATLEFYHLTTKQAISYMELFVQYWDEWAALGRNPNDLVGSKTGRKKLASMIQDWRDGKNLIDFKEPRIWAPFVLVGNASLQAPNNSQDQHT